MNKYSERSIKLKKIAEEFVNLSPENLKTNVWITGSCSTGLSDNYSDLEICYFFDAIPPFYLLEELVSRLGGQIVHSDSVENDWTGIGVTFFWHNELIELNFSKKSSHLKNIIEASTVPDDGDFVTLPWIVKNAIPLKSDGFYEESLRHIEEYSDHFQREMILTSIHYWDYEHHLDTMFPLAIRKEIPALSKKLNKEIEKLLRYLYAINKEWEPSYKWTLHFTDSLKIKPKDLNKRINSILTLIDPGMSVIYFWKLAFEALELNTTDINLERYKEQIKATLEKY